MEGLKIAAFAVAVTVAVLATAIGITVGIGIANSHWNCSSWRKATGDVTQVVAGECMVKNQRTGRWEIYGSYIRDHHVGIHNDNVQD